MVSQSADIEVLSKKLGLYSPPDPENKDGHVPTLLIGNEATGQWIRGSALDNPKLTAMMITSWVARYPPAAPIRSYMEAHAIHNLTRGQYLFRTKCSACHSLGTTDKIGPDLAGITLVRERVWLVQYIAHPDEMLARDDPIAKALFAQYKGMRMPNLELRADQIEDVVVYLDGVRAAHRQ